MKISFTLPLILASVFFLSACEFQQDPLAQASPQVRDGKEPDSNKVEPAKAFPKEALSIEAPNLVNGGVGSPIEIKITGRMMIPGIAHKIRITNLDLFPGATFDETSGNFVWTPTKDFLRGAVSAEASLNVMMSTDVSPTNQVVTVETKSITIVVVNTFQRPEVKSVSGPKALVVGNYYNFDFVVVDLDAVNVSDVRVVATECEGNVYERSIASVVTYKQGSLRADPTTPGRYLGQLLVNLTEASVLDYDIYCLGVMAVSRHGQLSPILEHSVTIEPRLTPTVNSMESTPVMKIGAFAEFHFTIFDPTDLGEVSLVSVNDLSKELPGSSIVCRPRDYNPSQLDCVATIVTGGAVMGNYYYKLRVRNFSTRTKQEIFDDHSFRISVRNP